TAHPTAHPTAPAAPAVRPAGNVRRFVPPADPAAPDPVEARTEAERQLLAAIRAAKEGVA
ncbi:MAG: hypothetical protein WD470_04430, partial [Rhodospirillaceae bacterium]